MIQIFKNMFYLFKHRKKIDLIEIVYNFNDLQEMKFYTNLSEDSIKKLVEKHKAKQIKIIINLNEI